MATDRPEPKAGVSVYGGGRRCTNLGMGDETEQRRKLATYPPPTCRATGQEEHGCSHLLLGVHLLLGKSWRWSPVHSRWGGRDAGQGSGSGSRWGGVVERTDAGTGVNGVGMERFVVKEDEGRK